MYDKISHFWTSVQRLFPFIEEELGPISPKQRRLIEVLELVRLESFVLPRSDFGRPAKNRVPLARAFIAKILYRIPFNDLLRDLILSDKNLRKICGWESRRSVPSSATFSRAFAEFAANELPERAHEALVRNAYERELVEHLVVDSMPTATREKPIKVKPLTAAMPSKHGEGETKPDKRTRVERHASGELSIEDMLRELPQHPSRGMKKKPSGCNYVWNGYKFHIASDDHGVPLVARLTSATLNDHEVAIPIVMLAEQRCDYLYTLMDAAYDVKAVKGKIREMGHVPITNKRAYNKQQKAEIIAEKRRQAVINWEPPERRRYRLRSKGERPNALMKDFYGAGMIYYRGHQKVFCHLMFGILALTATTLLGFT